MNGWTEAQFAALRAGTTTGDTKVDAPVVQHELEGEFHGELGPLKQVNCGSGPGFINHNLVPGKPLDRCEMHYSERRQGQ